MVNGLLQTFGFFVLFVSIPVTRTLFGFHIRAPDLGVLEPMAFGKIDHNEDVKWTQNDGPHWDTVHHFGYFGGPGRSPVLLKTPSAESLQVIVLLLLQRAALAATWAWSGPVCAAAVMVRPLYCLRFTGPTLIACPKGSGYIVPLWRYHRDPSHTPPPAKTSPNKLRITLSEELFGPYLGQGVVVKAGTICDKPQFQNGFAS